MQARRTVWCGGVMAAALTLLGGCGVSGGSESSSTAESAETNDAEADVRAAALQLRPLLAVGSKDGPCPSEADLSSLPSADGNACLTVGPVGFTGADLATAAATNQNGSWNIDVTVEASARARANDLFNECYLGEPTCPNLSSDGHGSVAIVSDGEVLSAPAVNGPDLADDAFTILGTFTEAEARDLARVLDG